jgi:hypothetical protein
MKVIRTTDNDDTHWIEVIDGQGLFPIKMLGPYATVRLAERARRGVMRLLNAARYHVAVVSQQDLDGRKQGHEFTSTACH